DRERQAASHDRSRRGVRDDRVGRSVSARRAAGVLQLFVSRCRDHRVMVKTPDPKLVETLREKALLLLQRERELYAMRETRDRTSAWLRAFARLATTTSDVQHEWASSMVRDLHFQRAAIYKRAGDALQTVVVQTNAPFPAQIDLDAEALTGLDLD